MSLYPVDTGLFLRVRDDGMGYQITWQLNLFDPDGSRAELMEPFTIR